jgi:hypothetical protein
MDLSIISLIISSITALGAVITTLHIKKCHTGCIDSECFRSRPSSPLEKQPILNI